MSTLTDYNVVFGMKKVSNSNVKFIRSVDPILDAIISDFRGVNHCDNLLGAINNVLMQVNKEE